MCLSVYFGFQLTYSTLLPTNTKDVCLTYLLINPCSNEVGMETVLHLGPQCNINFSRFRVSKIISYTSHNTEQPFSDINIKNNCSIIIMTFTILWLSIHYCYQDLYLIQLLIEKLIHFNFFGQDYIFVVFPTLLFF